MSRFSLSTFFDRNFVLKEAFVATLFTVLITFGVSFLPIKFEFSKAIRQGFLGFDIYDLHYSGKHLKKATRDTNIVLVQIADNRSAIADQINVIRKHAPAVLGVDAVFKTEQDPLEDVKLLQAINDTSDLVMGIELDTVHGGKDLVAIKNFFQDKGNEITAGHINFLGQEYSVIRYYVPFVQVQNVRYPAFSTAIVEKYSPSKFERLRDRRNVKEIINYDKNLENYNSITSDQLYELDSSGQLGGLISNKIVLLGYFVKKSPSTPLVLDDLKFTPLNEHVAGKSFPDMYGVVVHANIISMILDEDYANEAPEILSYILAILFIFFFIWYMLSQYKKHEHPKHGKFLLIQFLGIILVLYIFLMIFDLFLVKVPLLPIMIALVLCVELLGVYKNLAIWWHKKNGYKTVFTHKH